MCVCVCVCVCVMCEEYNIGTSYYFWGSFRYISVGLVKHGVLTVVSDTRCYRNDPYCDITMSLKVMNWINL